LVLNGLVLIKIGEDSPKTQLANRHKKKQESEKILAHKKEVSLL